MNTEFFYNIINAMNYCVCVNNIIIISSLYSYILIVKDKKI